MKKIKLHFLRESRIELSLFLDWCALAILSTSVLKVSTFGTLLKVHGAADIGSVLPGNKWQNLRNMGSILDEDL